MRALRLMAPLILLGGCAGARAGQRAGAAIEVVPDSEPEPPARPPLQVRLLEPGEEPRHTLRYAVARGQAEPLQVTLGNALLLAIGEMSPPEVRSPPLRLSLELTAQAIDPGGEMTVEGTVVAGEVPPDADVPQALRAAVAGDSDRLRQAHLRAQVTARGLVLRLSLPPPPDASPQLLVMTGWLRDALAALLPPLPEEPVGAGARWEVHRRVQVGPAEADERVIYALADAHRHLVVTLDLIGGAQTPAVAGLPPGATVSFASLAGSGGGEVDLDLTHLVQSTELRWSSTALGTTQPAGQPPAPVRLTASATVSLKPPP